MLLASGLEECGRLSVLIDSLLFLARAEILDHQHHLRAVGRHDVRVQSAIAGKGGVELMRGHRGMKPFLGPIPEPATLDRHEVGMRNLMWSTDYPHSDSTWPHSRKYIEEAFDGVPDDERHQLLAGNAIELYRL